MGWNGLDLVNDFSAELGDVSSAFKTKVLRWVNEGIKDISTSHEWPCLREKGQAVLVADEDTHSITLAKPTAPTVAALAGGSLALLTEYKVLVTYYESVSGVESIAGEASAGITPLGANLAITVSLIPISTCPLVTSRKVYVSVAGAAFQYHGTISNNLTSTPATISSLTSQGVTYTALVAAADFITVEVIDSTVGGLSFTEIAGAIVIDLGGATADVNGIVALLAGSIYVDATGSGATSVVVTAQTPLTGGSDITPVTYEITAPPTSVITPPDENLVWKIDGDLFIEGERVINGTSLQDIIFSSNGVPASGTPSKWAAVNEEEVRVYPTPSTAKTATFHYFKLPAQVFGINTSVPQIPSWLREDLKNYVIWRGYSYRDRAGQESKKINYDEGLKKTISRKGKAIKKSGRVRSVTPDSDGYGT